MIRLNLLPRKHSKRRDVAVRELSLGGGVIGATLFILYLCYAVVNSRLKNTEQALSHVKNDISRLQLEIIKVEDFKNKKTELEKKLAVIEDLKAKKTGPAKLLDELASNIPRKVWLLSFEEKNGQMTLEGGSGDNDDVSDFLAYLTKRSHFFTKTMLSYSETIAPTQTDKDKAKISFVKFKMTGVAQYGILPPDASKGK